MLKALADRLAEAFAEVLHKRVRRNYGAMRRMRIYATNLIMKNTGAFARPPVIPLARTTPKKPLCSHC